MDNNLIVSYAPHIHGNQNIRNIMLDVIIAMIPALIGGIYFFGLNALVTVAASALFCVFFEYVWNKATKKESTTSGFTAGRYHKIDISRKTDRLCRKIRSRRGSASSLGTLLYTEEAIL